jgi:hypothetical protein
MLEKINESFIFYNSNHDLIVGEYYIHCVNILKEFLKSYKKPINIILGNYPTNFNNENKTIRIGLQIEHIIVKYDVPVNSTHIMCNPVKYNNTDYLVRIDNLEYLESFDYVIEYSLPNINHMGSVKDNLRLQQYLHKNIHISTNIYDINFSKINRNQIITLFFAWSNRRAKFKDDVNKKNIQVLNIDNCFTKKCLTDVYDNTKILVNIHQTDYHETVEELRILPALMSGVIVIAEDSPYKETIPYYEYIIWEKIENIPQKILEVNENYDFFHEKIFGGDRLKNVLIEMDKQNLKNVIEKII